jgi:hypothetical protein
LDGLFDSSVSRCSCDPHTSAGTVMISTAAPQKTPPALA